MSSIFNELENIFHEPNRLAIVSALSGAPKGRTFTELKAECNLTDGNLSRHIVALEKAGVIKTEKTFVANRPRTTAMLSNTGRKSFLKYLDSLERVLKHAAKRATSEDARLPHGAKATKA
ncbi:MAG: transcriptional regulator [Deltaproteobacteria bacterium]|nr:transcriptional regulator [Deltaproteobacteria bacterium]